MTMMKSIQHKPQNVIFLFHRCGCTSTTFLSSITECDSVTDLKKKIQKEEMEFRAGSKDEDYEEGSFRNEDEDEEEYSGSKKKRHPRARKPPLRNSARITQKNAPSKKKREGMIQLKLIFDHLIIPIFVRKIRKWGGKY
jgi:hypothetical protein